MPDDQKPQGEPQAVTDRPPPSLKEKLEQNVFSVALVVAATFTGGTYAVTSVLFGRSIDVRDQRIEALAAECASRGIVPPTGMASAKPRRLTVSDETPTKKWLLDHLESLGAGVAAEQQQGVIADFRPVNLRTPPLTEPASSFIWRVSARPHEIRADHAFLVSGDGTRFIELERQPGSASEVVFRVPAASRGDILSLPLVVVSRTARLQGQVTGTLTSRVE